MVVLEVLLQMAGLILCGVAWQIVKPAGLATYETRQVLTSLVYYLLLPSLVLTVLWDAQLGEQSLVIAVAAASGIFTGLLLAFASCRLCRHSSAEMGAVIPAVSFPNVTYMGLPVLEAMYGPWARSVAIQYDLFACTPLLFTVGVLLAARFGEAAGSEKSLPGQLFRIPAMWAAVVAVLLNVSGVIQPELVRGLLGLLERGVVPLMLISIGLSLQWDRTRWRLLPSLVPIVLFKLLLIPLVVLILVNALGFDGDLRAAVVMEAAMPTMVLGLVLCDRFKLDVGLYAAAVTVTTALSLISLPLWFEWLSA